MAIYEAISSGTVTYGNDEFTVSEPAGISSGDLEVLCGCAEGGPDVTEQTSTDWTELDEHEGGSSALRKTTFAHARGGSAPGLVFDLASSYAQGWAMIRVSGADTSALGSIVTSSDAGGFDQTENVASMTCANDDLALIFSFNTQDTYTY